MDYHDSAVGTGCCRDSHSAQATSSRPPSFGSEDRSHAKNYRPLLLFGSGEGLFGEYREANVSASMKSSGFLRARDVLAPLREKAPIVGRQ
jgi:hypothetical protein